MVGGGLAGCSLGIQLAREGADVLVLEKQRYPAHKLCGEFLSTEVRALFDRLGVLEAVEKAGAHPIRRALLTAAGGAQMRVDLPGTALGLSRYRLDPLLLDAARRAGAEALDNCAVVDVEKTARGFLVHTSTHTIEASLVLGAYGKRSRLDGRLGRDFLAMRSPFVAFKAHFSGGALGDWIELHAFPGGYCGLSHIENGLVNVCWISHTDALRAGGGSPEGMLAQVLPQNPHLARRLGTLRRVSARFEAVSQVTFMQKGTTDGGMGMAGDTAAMITPFCGDGMAMALQSAEMMAPLALQTLNGDLDRRGYEKAYNHAWQAQFGQRLWLGRLLHHAFISPRWAQAMVRAGAAFPRASAFVVARTRG